MGQMVVESQSSFELLLLTSSHQPCWPYSIILCTSWDFVFIILNYTWYYQNKWRHNLYPSNCKDILHKTTFCIINNRTSNTNSIIYLPILYFLWKALHAHFQKLPWKYRLTLSVAHQAMYLNTGLSYDFLPVLELKREVLDQTHHHFYLPISVNGYWPGKIREFLIIHWMG